MTNLFIYWLLYERADLAKLSVWPGEECVVDQFLMVHEAEAYKPVGLSHAERASTGMVFFGGTPGIIELVDGCQRLEERFVHVSLLLLITGAGESERRIPEHREIIAVRLLIPEEVDRDHLPVNENGQSVAAFCGITLRESPLSIRHPVVQQLFVALRTAPYALACQAHMYMIPDFALRVSELRPVLRLHAREGAGLPAPQIGVGH